MRKGGERKPSEKNLWSSNIIETHSEQVKVYLTLTLVDIEIFQMNCCLFSCPYCATPNSLTSSFSLAILRLALSPACPLLPPLAFVTSSEYPPCIFVFSPPNQISPWSYHPLILSSLHTPPLVPSSLVPFLPSLPLSLRTIPLVIVLPIPQTHTSHHLC